MRNRQQLLAKLVASNKDTPRFVRAEQSGAEARIYVYDVIDPYWGISAVDFVAALNGIDAETIHVHYNSPGGDVFEARAMLTALSAHPAKVVSHIDGLAASAASYLALSGDEVQMAEGSFLMIHKAWGMVIGNSDDLRGTADLLDKIDSSIVDEYMKRTSAERAQIESWMTAETWFTAQEALDAKFVDSISGTQNKSARWNLSAYGSVPEQLQAAQDKDDLDRAARARRIDMLLQEVC